MCTFYQSIFDRISFIFFDARTNWLPLSENMTLWKLSIHTNHRNTINNCSNFNVSVYAQMRYIMNIQNIVFFLVWVTPYYCRIFRSTVGHDNQLQKCCSRSTLEFIVYIDHSHTCSFLIHVASPFVNQQSNTI